MRSLYQFRGLLLVLVLVPGLAASCAGDESSGEAGSGGDDGWGASGGEPSSGGQHTSGGKSSTGPGGHTAEAGEAGGGMGTTGGQASAGAAPDQGGASSGSGGASSGGASSGGATTAGEAGTQGGAGGEGGAPIALDHIVVFDAGPHNGLNFGGRLGLDQHCATAKTAQSIPGAVTHALISVSATDELRDMPALYAVPTSLALLGPTGKKLADNWADLLDGNVDQSLTSAEVSSADFWISGSNADGSVRSTCNGWTYGQFDQQVTGTYGYPGNADSFWITITDGDVYCSASQYHVICLAYD